MGLIRTIINYVASNDSTNAVFSDDTSVSESRSYFNRVDDREQVGTAIKDIYGKGIRQEQDPSRKGADSTYETYVKAGFATQVDTDMVEMLSIGFGHKVINAHATLFTEAGNRYVLAGETDETDVEAAEELLDENRKSGGRKTVLVRADKLAMQLQSSAILMSFEQSSMTYQKFSPDDVRFFHGETISEEGVDENGEATWTERAVDPTSVEDAAWIIIRLGMVNNQEWNYLAIYGRSNTYPKGRYCIYTAGNTIAIPDPDSKNIVNEFEIAGELCNPLSYIADADPDSSTPEYPIAIIYGGLTESSGVMPVTTSLHKQCLEFSRAASHTLSTSQKAAAGTVAIESDEVGQNQPLPQSLSGDVSLRAGQKIVSVPHDSTASVDAYKVLKDMMVDAGAAYSVPDFMITSEDYTLDASSGRALDIKARPLKKFREYRVEENQASILKMFNVEKALIGLFSDADESVLTLLDSCTQTWIAGEIKLPENKKEVAERVVSMMGLGLYDTIAGIRELYQLGSDKEAEDVYRRMEERKEEFPALVKEEEPKKAVGLFSRQK
ncbi:MAG: hypothetical protein GY847_28970 [Proteobacteria bacterium]|nr:hypothetical protein [Pseudomonadota bacterium]